MNIRKQTFSGIKWTSIGTLGRSLFQLLQISILTRFLEKEAFGLIAMTLVVINFSNIFIDMGMSSALLFKQNATKKELSSIYWLNIFISIVLYLTIVAFTPLIANFYNEPELKKLIPILGINLIIMAIGRQHRTLMQKKFRFKSITVVDIVSIIGGLIVAVILAERGYGVYSLVYSSLLVSLISNFAFLIINIKSNPILLFFDFKDASIFLKVGGFNMASNIVDFFSRESDILIIGKFMGAETLGVYSLSKQIVMKLYQITNPILINVLNPLLSSLQNEKEKLKNYVLKAVYILASINFPVYLFLTILSKEILTIVYGVDYASGYLVLAFLAISYATTSIDHPSGSLQIATGRTDIGFKWTLIRVSLIPIVVALTAQFSINAVAIGIALLNLSLVPLLWRIQLKPMANIKLIEYLNQFLKPYSFFLGITIFCMVSSKYVIPDLGIIPTIVIKGFSGFILYIGLTLILDKNRVRDFFSLLKIKKSPI